MKNKRGLFTVAEVRMKNNKKYPELKSEEMAIMPIMDMKDMLVKSSERFCARKAFEIKAGEKSWRTITYKMLQDDVNALGTFLIYNGLKGKHIAIMEECSYDWAVSYLAIICGAGVAVPLDPDWELHELKRYTIDTDCCCIITSEVYRDHAWELYNDSVTPLQTYICAGLKENEDPFLSMDEAMKDGRSCIAFGNREFLDAKTACNDLATIQFTMELAEAPKPIMLTQGDVANFLMTASGILPVDEREVSFPALLKSRSLEMMCKLLLPLYQGATAAVCEGKSFGRD